MRADSEREALLRLRRLLENQPLAVLSTQQDGNPYSSLVAFAATGNFKELIFATGRSTRKFRNLATAPGAAMLVDNRSNRPDDFLDAIAVTATGFVTEAAVEQVDVFRGLLLAKHPGLRDFLDTPGTALMGLRVSSYYLVERFESVREFDMSGRD